MSPNPSEVWDQRFVPNNTFSVTTAQDLRLDSLQDLAQYQVFRLRPMRIYGLITQGEAYMYISLIPHVMLRKALCKTCEKIFILCQMRTRSPTSLTRSLNFLFYQKEFNRWT